MSPFRFCRPAFLQQAACSALLLASASVAAAQVQIISGFNFGQFLYSGEPVTDYAGGSTPPVGSVPSNYGVDVTGPTPVTRVPTPDDAGVERFATQVDGTFSAGESRLYFDGSNSSHNFDGFGGGTPGSVTVTELAANDATNAQTVDPIVELYPGDANNATLRFTSSGSVNRFSIVTDTTLFSDYETGLIPADSNFSFAASAITGTGSVEFFLGSNSLGSFNVTPGVLQAFTMDLPEDFYGLADATLIAQVTGDLNFDHIQINGYFGAPPASALIFWKEGDGVWSAAATPKNWLDENDVQVAWTGEVAVFDGTAGTVTVDDTDDPVEFTGAKFLTTGYIIAAAGDSTLKTTTASTKIEVGDGLTATISAPISGTGGIRKMEEGTLVLSGANTYTGGTTVSAGTLQQGAAGAFVANTAYTVNGGTLDLNDHALTASALAGSGGTVDLGSATLTVNQSTGTTYAGNITGTGGLTKSGTGTLTLTGPNTYTGATTVGAGTLRLNGDQSLATGAITVASGGTLSGTGKTGGNVTIANGGTLAGISGSTLTMGNLVLNSSAIVSVELGAIVPKELFKVNGNLTLDGTLDIKAGTGFEDGLYRLFTYTGTLTDNTLEIGTVPGSASGYSIKTDVAKQVNLMSKLVTFPMWTGESNVWSADPDAGGWGTDDGSETGGWQPGLAVFQAEDGGTITVDTTAGDVVVKGIQFASDGFSIEGDALTNKTANAKFRVGMVNTVPEDAALTATIASVITGTGGVDKVGAGTLVLSGENTHTGGTRVTEGVLEIASDKALGAASGVLRLNGGTLRAGATLTSARSVIVSATGGTLDTGANTVTLSGLISGTGAITKRGSGTLAVSGENTYSGTTTIAEGAVRLDNGRLGAVSVSSGARLTGTGTVQGDLTNGGTVSPGSSPGTITIVGNFAQSAGGTYAVELAGPTSYDKLEAGGSVTLDGALTVTGLNGFKPGTGQIFKIITATGGRTGKFASVTSPWSNLYAMQRFDVFYNANDVSVGLTQLPFAGLSGSTNQVAIGKAIDAALAGGTIPTLGLALNTLATQDEVRAALAQLSPQRYERWFSQALYNTSALVRATESRHLERQEGDRGGLWMQIVRRQSDYAAAGESAAAKGNADGILVGAEMAATERLHAGVLLGYTDEMIELDQTGSRTDAKRYSGAIYGRYAGPRAFVEAVLGASYADLSNSRTVTIPGQTGVAEGATESSDMYASVRTGLNTKLGATHLTPYLAIQHMSWTANELVEAEAGDASLTVRGQSADSLASRVGLMLSLPFSGKNLTLTPRLDVAWRFEFQDKIREITAELGGTDFTVSTGAPSRSGLVASLGLDAAFASGVSAYARLTTEQNTAADEAFEARAGVDYRF